MASRSNLPVVFLAFASIVTPYGGNYLPQLADEARELRTALDHSGRCEVVVRENVTLNDILIVFQDERYHGRIAVFHYGGHAENDFLILQTDAGKLLPAHATGFAAFLAEQPGLKLVFLNACSTEPQVKDLLAAGVGAVVATSKEIPDDLARPLAARFYKGLAGGATIESAFRAAKSEPLIIHGAVEDWLWNIHGRTETSLAWALPAAGAPRATGRLWVGVPGLVNLDNIVGRQHLLDNLVQRLLTGRSPALSTDGLPGVVRQH